MLLYIRYTLQVTNVRVLPIILETEIPAHGLNATKCSILDLDFQN